MSLAYSMLRMNTFYICTICSIMIILLNVCNNRSWKLELAMTDLTDLICTIPTHLYIWWDKHSHVFILHSFWSSYLLHKVFVKCEIVTVCVGVCEASWNVPTLGLIALENRLVQRVNKYFFHFIQKMPRSHHTLWH